MLVLDTYSSYGSPGGFPDLSFVEVKFLPANTTSQIQRRYGAIVSTLKRRYRMLQYGRVLSAMDGDEKSYNPD